MAVSPTATVALAQNVAAIVKSVYGKSKKCLVLDLDNTLWGGVVGDDGVQNLILGRDHPVGEAFLDFQQYVKGPAAAWRDSRRMLEERHRKRQRRFLAPGQHLEAGRFQRIQSQLESEAREHPRDRRGAQHRS